jgi:hypothetical protein
MRLAAITTTALLAAACSLQSEELATTSIECTTNDDGSTTCSEGDDHPGDEDTPPDGDLVCSGTGCVSECQYSDDSFHCSITCENGLRCESNCSEGSCNVSCDCPDGGGGGGCGDNPTDECCQEHPEDPACHTGCPDGTEDCSCEERPDDPDCQDPPPPCPDGSTDEECEYCREHPDDTQCQDPQPCPEDDTACCREGEDCQP